MNKLVKDIDLEGKKTDGLKGSDKVPEHAKLVVDNEA